MPLLDHVVPPQQWRSQKPVRNLGISCWDEPKIKTSQYTWKPSQLVFTWWQFLTKLLVYKNVLHLSHICINFPLSFNSSGDRDCLCGANWAFLGRCQKTCLLVAGVQPSAHHTSCRLTWAQHCWRNPYLSWINPNHTWIEIIRKSDLTGMWLSIRSTDWCLCSW